MKLMNKRIASYIKYNKSLLRLYRAFGNTCISIIRRFIKQDDKTILFMSFGGQKYDDSPRAIYETIKEDSFFKDYKLVWAFTNPTNQPEIGCKKIKTETIGFYHTAISSKYWIHNSSMERGLKLKSIDTFELNTNHGIPVKYYGRDIKGTDNYSSNSQREKDIYHCAQSEYERDIYVRAIGADPNKFLMFGLPRNDSLHKYSEQDIQRIRTNLHIPDDRKIILYAPTFREYDRDELNACYINPPIDKEKWKSVLGDNFVILFRAHYEVINVLGISDDGFFYNVSSYPYLNDLIIIADLLITDYSSIMYDFSITDKPIFSFCYDYDVYAEKRGLYLDYKRDFPGRFNCSEDELLEEMLHYDPEERKEITAAFHKKYATFSGSASQQVVLFLKNKINAEYNDYK